MIRTVTLFLASLIAASVISFAQVAPSVPFALADYATSDAGDDNAPKIATDGAGVWIAVWSSTSNVSTLSGDSGTDSDILFSRSTTNGSIWEAADILNGNHADARSDSWPVTIDFGLNRWVVAWSSNDNILGAGSDIDVFVAQSDDGGDTWTAPALLNTNGTGDTGSDGNIGLDIASDGMGNWIAVWASTDDLGATIGTDRDILVATSGTNGDAWSTPVPLNNNADTDSGLDGFGTVSIVTDKMGTWIAAWSSDEDLNSTAGADQDIFFSRSVDNGATWSDPAVLNSAALGDTQANSFPVLAADGVGRWVAVWTSIEGAKGFSDTYIYSRSSDNGISWAAEEPLADAGGDLSLFLDEPAPTLITDRAGNWVAAWGFDESVIDDTASDDDLVVVVSQDGGANWSDPVLLDTNGTTDDGSDFRPSIATDGAGHWVAVWDSLDQTTGNGADADIIASNFVLDPSIADVISGQITFPGGAPVTCASVEATLQGGSVTGVAVTDLNGEYFFAGLANGVYDIRVFSPDFGVVSGGVADITSGPISDFNLEIAPAAVSQAVRGRVIDDATGEPLVGVFVEALFNNAVVSATYTCASGDYILSLEGIGKGAVTVDLRYTLDNYTTKTTPGVNVPPDGTEQNETMAKAVEFPASLSGTVNATNKGVAALPNARVTLRGPSNLNATTDTNGAYSFNDVLGGEYTITASADGYEGRVVSKVISGSEAVIQTFELSREGGAFGDINNDGELNASDIQLVINAVLGVAPGGTNGDVNNDGETNASDVQLVINAVLGV